MLGRNVCTDPESCVCYLYSSSWLHMVFSGITFIITGFLHMRSSSSLFYVGSRPLLTKVRNCYALCCISEYLHAGKSRSLYTRSETAKTKTTKMVCNDWRQYHDTKCLLAVVSLYGRDLHRDHIYSEMYFVQNKKQDRTHAGTLLSVVNIGRSIRSAWPG
jgi:hypothetical protein